MDLNFSSWEARQWKCWECVLFWWNRGFSKEPPVVWERQFVGSAVGTSSGNGSFGACGSETVSDTVMGLNETFAGAESAQCGERGVLTEHVSRNT